MEMHPFGKDDYNLESIRRHFGVVKKSPKNKPEATATAVHAQAMEVNSPKVKSEMPCGRSIEDVMDYISKTHQASVNRTSTGSHGKELDAGMDAVQFLLQQRKLNLCHKSTQCSLENFELPSQALKTDKINNSHGVFEALNKGGVDTKVDSPKVKTSNDAIDITQGLQQSIRDESLISTHGMFTFSMLNYKEVKLDLEKDTKIDVPNSPSGKDIKACDSMEEPKLDAVEEINVNISQPELSDFEVQSEKTVCQTERTMEPMKCDGLLGIESDSDDKNQELSDSPVPSSSSEHSSIVSVREGTLSLAAIRRHNAQYRRRATIFSERSDSISTKGSPTDSIYSRQSGISTPSRMSSADLLEINKQQCRLQEEINRTKKFIMTQRSMKKNQSKHRSKVAKDTQSEILENKKCTDNMEPREAPGGDGAGDIVSFERLKDLPSNDQLMTQIRTPKKDACTETEKVLGASYRDAVNSKLILPVIRKIQSRYAAQFTQDLNILEELEQLPKRMVEMYSDVNENN